MRTSGDEGQYEDVKPVTGGEGAVPAPPDAKSRQRSRRKHDDEADEDLSKRQCVSTACIACRKRKSKCDGNTPACAACSQVYGTRCVYDPNSDHRRKGVYKNETDASKTRNATLHTLIQAILNYPEEDVPALVREIRTCESLDTVAEMINIKEEGLEREQSDDEQPSDGSGVAPEPTFENQLYGKMGDLRLDGGSVRYIGGTSNLIHMTQDDQGAEVDEYPQQEDPITSWTNVTDDAELILHLVRMYLLWHLPFFLTLSPSLFMKDFLLGLPPPNTKRKTHFCTPLLLNTILALGCHFTSHSGARLNPEDSATAGDHFFAEAKRLIMENDEHEKPRLATVQALALMSVREAGCGREAKGWIYSGMSFRMACDMGLNLDTGQLSTYKNLNGGDAEEDARRITFWGCFLFDKCWSNYLGRLPQLPKSMVTVPKFEVFPDEDSAQWSPYSDSGFAKEHSQPARTRAVALQISKLCEINDDLMRYFYNPSDIDRSKAKSVKMASDIHIRLESWRKQLPMEMEPREGGLPSILVMHMFFQILFIHLFRPFLKYTRATSPLPHNVSPRKICTQAATMISKLMRLYKRSYGLRQICNITVYIAHSACTIHLLNLPDKNARRDIVHGVKQLEEIAEGWLGARRTLRILSMLSRRWNIELPQEAAEILRRADARFGGDPEETPSPLALSHTSESALETSRHSEQQSWQNPALATNISTDFNNTTAPNVTATAPNTAPAVPLDNGGFIPSPHIHKNLQTPHYTSTSTPPQNKWQSTKLRKPSTSPTDLFGGVEGLIRDSNDWVYRDQAQFGTGFENWNLADINPSLWLNAAAGISSTGADAGVGELVPSTMSMPVSSGNMNEFVTGENVAMNGTSGYAPQDWTAGMNAYNHMATNNDADW